MNKLFAIGWKDIMLLMRDRAALILMLGAPFVLIVGMGLVTGAFSDSAESGIPRFSVALVDEDGGDLALALSNVLASDEIGELLTVIEVNSAEEARGLVANDEVAAAILIPAGYTAGMLPNAETGASSAEAPPIQLIENPGAPISASVVAAILDEFHTRVDTSITSVGVSMQQLIQSGRLDFSDAEAMQVAGQAMAERQVSASLSAENQPILLVTSSDTNGDSAEFNPLAYLAPGMAVLFLMFTVTQGGRSILDERNGGTLGRLLVTPTTPVQVLGGKTLGIFLSGVAQLLILIGGSALLFGLDWGDPLSVLLIILATCGAATGWGLLLASLARTPAQVSSVGIALMLGFGILGGSFFPVSSDGAIAWLRKLTPNAWALDSFSALATGGSLSDIVPMLMALVVMGIVLFAIAVFFFRQNRQQQLA